MQCVEWCFTIKELPTLIASVTTIGAYLKWQMDITRYLDLVY